MGSGKVAFGTGLRRLRPTQFINWSMIQVDCEVQNGWGCILWTWESIFTFRPKDELRRGIVLTVWERDPFRRVTPGSEYAFCFCFQNIILHLLVFSWYPFNSTYRSNTLSCATYYKSYMKGNIGQSYICYCYLNDIFISHTW